MDINRSPGASQGAKDDSQGAPPPPSFETQALSQLENHAQALQRHHKGTTKEPQKY